MDRNLDYTLLYRVAKAYFNEQRTQQEIADVENFSRSQISRLLKKALDENLVRYTLAFPADVDESELAEKVRAILGIEKVVLIPSFYNDYSKVGVDEITKNLTLGTAELMEDLLGDARSIGLGWGRAMYNTSLYVRTRGKVVKGREFLPLIGLSGNHNPMLQINTIVDRFGERFHADRYYVNLPSLLSSSITPDTPMYPRELFEKWDHLDCAVVGLGASPINNKNLIVELPGSHKKHLRSSGTVGDMLSQFFYEDGRILELDSKFSLLALDIRRLRSVPNVIVPAAGPDKVEPICVAAKLGFMKTLVTDYNTAKIILNQKGENLQ